MANTLEQISTSLASTSLFDRLSAPSRQALARACSTQAVSKREILFMEGQAGRAVYVLLEGLVQLSKMSADGKEVVIRVVRPGEMFAEVVLFERDEYPVTAETLAPGRLLSLPRRALRELLEHPDFREDFISALMGKLRYLAGRVHQLSAEDAEKRLMLFLRDHFGAVETMDINMSKKDVALAISTTPETLSRLIQRMRDEGGPVWEGRRIEFPPGFWDQFEEWG